MITKRLLSFLCKTAFAILFFTVTAQATTYTVTNTSVYESWATPIAGSLRKALDDAAAAGVGPHTILFDFTALGANPVFTFTGWEHTGDVTALSFRFYGTNITLDAITGRPVGGSVTFTSTPSVGHAVFRVFGTNNTVKGITFRATTNIAYGLRVEGTGHTIQQNTFVNGTGYGMYMTNTTNVSVYNNLFENNALGGMLLENSNHGARLGGCAVGQANTIIRNGYSANISRDDEGNGITFGGQSTNCIASAGNPIIIAGNFIGTTSALNYQDVSLNFLGNSHHGISLWQSSNVTVGGACPNYVANNGYRRIASGISIYASNTITVDNNIVGTDGVTGKKIGNKFDGILIHAANANTVTNNVVGNSVNGIAIRNSIGAPGVQPVNNIISNNKIGVDNSGNFISTASAGITLENNAANNTIQSNTIKSVGTSFSYGNGQTNPVTFAGTGIWIVGNTAGNQSNSVFLNTIGRQSGDPVAANNVGNAVLIDRSTDNLIGDLAKGNIIGSNGVTSDIVVTGASTIRNKITYNQFVCSGSFATKGIELQSSGNNGFGNPSFVFVDMSSTGGIVTGGAPANSTVHVYSKAANCNQCSTATSGNYSRGLALLGIVTTNASGVWSFTTGQPASNIVVTATDASNNTSEFSYCSTPLGICPTAAAGSDQTLCNITTATLAGNDPSADGGVGSWTTIIGTGVATTPGSPTSGVTGLTIGASTTFRWTVTKGGCTTTSDDVVITVSALITANAGSAQTICNLTTATLAGNNPAPGTGLWTRTAGTGTITSPTLFNSGVTGLTVGATSTFQWVITNGACVSAPSTVNITVSAPVTASAGPAQTICNLTTATLAATVPSPGSGAWTTTAGTGVVTTPGSATSGVTGLTVGASSTFLWTVTNGACSATSSVTITSSVQPTSNAGAAQAVCNTTTATLAATVPSPGSGAWTTVTGTGVATTPSSASSGVTGLTIGAATTFRWTVTNGACSAISTVTITVSSPVVLNTPSSQTICNTTSGSVTASTATGTWSTFSGTGSASTPTTQTSAVTGLTVGATSVFNWTVTIGACTGVLDRVSITVSSPVVMNTPSSQTICNSTSGSVTASTAAGTWSTLSGTGSASTPTTQTSAVTGLTVGATSVFNWTVSNGACSGVLDQVSITVSSPIVMNAATSQSLCNVTSSSITASTATGTWSTLSGTGTASTPTNQTSAVSGLTPGGTSVFNWTVTVGACTGVLDQVSIAVAAPLTPLPSSQTICNTTTANISASTSTGTWTTLSGTGIVTSPTTASSGVTGLTIGGTSVFEWSITNGGCGSAVSQQVTITVSSPAVVSQGADQFLCDVTTSTMTAVGTGTWSIVNGTGIISAGQLTNPTASVTGLTIGASSEFKWKVINGACRDSANVIINVMAPALVNSGADFTTCLGSFSLGALVPGAGYTGAWTSSNPSIVFTPASNPNAVVSGLTAGLNVLTWTVTGSGACSGTFTDQIVITFGSSNLGVTLSAPNDTACVGTPRTLSATAFGGSGNYSYVWISKLDINNPSINGAGVLLDTTSSATYTVSPEAEKNLYWLVLVDNVNRGCVTPLEADTIYAVNGQDLNVPNLITPNEDNHNDYWVLRDKVTGQDVLPGTTFDLYNRWGQRVFRMDSYDNRFKAENISDGIYYYYVKSGCGNKEYKGWLQILGNSKP